MSRFLMDASSNLACRLFRRSKGHRRRKSHETADCVILRSGDFVCGHAGRAAAGDVEPGFFGHSVGHWEADTLVADTVGIKEDIRYQNVPHTKDLRIKERIHLVAPNILWDEITMDDPAVLEKPWTVTVAYRRMPN